MKPSVQRWDIFCRVIDNFGDVGVCWRLARQLTEEYGLEVRLWVDDLATLRRLCPETKLALETQSCAGVEVRHWGADFPDVTPAEVVIEAFACELPANYLAAMAAMADLPPLWINLEYLTAEAWAAEAHGLPSPHPTLPLTKYFFFPGFAPNSGGLLRYPPSFQRKLESSFFNQCAMDSSFRWNDESLKVSLFGYENTALESLLDVWVQGTEPVVCLVPEGKLLPQLAVYFGRNLSAQAFVEKGSLNLTVLPFLSQDDYDRLLWACDLNFVRGEDSFVRAQWAAKPFVWHIYPQAEAAHLKKLEAFLSLYCADLPLEIAAFWRCWNTGQPIDWQEFWQHRATLQAHAKIWQKQLMNQADLASKLVNFHKNHI
jgi:uncharacterized repeat protein (TIGR03837 family)